MKHTRTAGLVLALQVSVVMVLGLLIYALLGLASDLLIRYAERRTLAWRRGLRAT